MLVESGTGLETSFGSINQTIGNQIINKTGEFDIIIEQYQSGVATILKPLMFQIADMYFQNGLIIIKQQIPRQLKRLLSN
jgi:hypothetical protein